MNRSLFLAALVSLGTAFTLGAICGDPADKTPTAVALATAIGLPPSNVGASLPTLEESARSFDEFPVLWLGDSYDSDGDGAGDMRLSSAYATHGRAFVHPLTGKELTPAITSFDLTYGTCEIPPHSQSCPIPISIDFYPVGTAAAPDEVSRMNGQRVRVRGVDATVYNGRALWFATADMEFSISVSSSRDSGSAPGTVSTLDQAIRIANQLYGANAKAAGITKDSDFRPKGAAAPLPTATRLVRSSLQLDLDPTTPGVQPSLATKDAQDVSIDIVLGENAGNVSAIDLKLIYDDTQLTSLSDGKGGLDGNPDFNDTALGKGWDCSLAGSPSADTDPDKGAGHGVALLSCFATGSGASVTSSTVIATLHLHAAAAASTSIALNDVHLTHDDGTEIGSCNPVINVELTCTGATLTAQ